MSTPHSTLPHADSFDGNEQITLYDPKRTEFDRSAHMTLDEVADYIEPGATGPAGADGRCQNFRLSTESGVAVSTADRTAQGTIYLTPYVGGQIALYNGSTWDLITSAEVSLALSSLTSGKNYDVFAYNNAGTVTLELSAAWTNDTTRADALTTQDGVRVKSGTTTRRLVGTIRTTGTATTEDSLAKGFVWNENNRVARPLSIIETTNTWNYTTDTIRQANGATGNKVEYVTGDATLAVEVVVCATAYVASNSARAAKVGVGVDSTTTFSGMVQGGYVQAAAGSYVGLTGTYKGYPGLGYHYLSWNEKGPDGTAVWVGDNGGDSQQSGIYAMIPR